MPVNQREKKLIFPVWLKQKVNVEKLIKMQEFLDDRGVKTVCENALCPNRGECYKRGTAAFLIMGLVCTRRCAFCAIQKGVPEKIDKLEPAKIAGAVQSLKLKHTVITSVTRDDLQDGGASQFARVVKAIGKNSFASTIEVLVPDFKGRFESIKKVVLAGPDIFNHNLETVPSLYKKIRPGADYRRSLSVLRTAKKINSEIITKSGLMLGLGEKFEEVEKVMDDLRKIDCDVLTLGQYLAPTLKHYPIKDFISPPLFKEYHNMGIKKGFFQVEAGPWVRSSYYADKININKINKNKNHDS